MSSTYDVVIIGAGAAGVATGRRLRETRPDLSFCVLEASRSTGGRARTAMVDGLPLDLGCGWLHGAKDNAWAALARQRGAQIDHALSPWDGAPRVLGLNGDDYRAATAATAAFFERADAHAEDEADMPMSAMLEAGNRWNGFIDAIGTFTNGADLAQASLRDYGCYEPGRGPDTRLVQGYGHFVEGCAAELPIRHNEAVRAIDHGGTRIRIETDRGTLEARSVVVTVSTTILARETIRFTPALPDKLEAAARLPLGLDNKLFLRLPDDRHFEPESHAMGSAERSRTASYHIRPFGRPIVECYFGGPLAVDLEVAGPEAAAAFAREELTALFGAEALRGVSLAACSAWRGAPFVGGAYSYAEPGAWDRRAILAAPVENRLFFAGEACSPHRFSTAHGAFETGVAAADAVAASLARV